MPTRAVAPWELLDEIVEIKNKEKIVSSEGRNLLDHVSLRSEGRRRGGEKKTEAQEETKNGQGI